MADSSPKYRQALKIPSLLTFAGVEPFVFQKTVQWALQQTGWRALFIRVALLTGLWIAVAFVFATEFYLTARGGPLKIPWMMAADSAFHDWFPWMLLSPLAVILAGQFRFERTAWRRSLAVHVAACFVFAAAYEALEMLFFTGPFLLATGTVGDGVAVTAAAPPGLPGFGGPVEVSGLPPPLAAGSNLMVMENGRVLRAGTGPIPFPEGSNTMMAASNGGFASVRPGVGMVFGFQGPPPQGRWMQFLHVAMLRTQFTVPIYLCIVCVCWVIGHFQEAGERERRTLELETRLTQANLRVLKMQLQPHFLFNTLNAISSLIHENPQAADNMVGSLSQFLRTTLEVSSKNEVPLRAELEFLDRYLEIQQTRFGSRLRICRYVDSAVMNARVPPLILQPLVENAIRYGIEPRETGGVVTIRAVREGDFLGLEVSDDGAGFSGGQLLRPGNGVGLANTTARLQTLYGDSHQFKLTANQPSGACVKIEIPFRLSPVPTPNET